MKDEIISKIKRLIDSGLMFEYDCSTSGVRLDRDAIKIFQDSPEEHKLQICGLDTYLPSEDVIDVYHKCFDYQQEHLEPILEKQRIEKELALIKEREESLKIINKYLES